MKALLCLAMLTFSAIAQTFELGSSLDDVYTEFGEPNRWWVPEPQQYLYSFEDYRAAVEMGTVVQDVYDRETMRNTYEIRLIRRVDSHDVLVAPTIRVSGLEFLPDKPRTFRETLADIAEARRICEAGCSVYGLDDTNRYVVLVFPTNPLVGQTLGATAAAYGYQPDFKPSHTYNWALNLSFKKRDAFRKIRAYPDWANSKIENVQIRPISLDYELQTWSGRATPQSLGSWQPQTRLTDMPDAVGPCVSCVSAPSRPPLPE